ncbi:MAG: hypothetical protein QOJ85_3751 [Solirubrobacteraceae bacterium]|jgi:hypothetical protein|nr:hypothetical protein [Solirubrobacteraceae bacterium]
MMRQRARGGRAASLLGAPPSLADAAQARIGRQVHAAIVLELGTRGPTTLIRTRTERVLLAVTDEDVYLLDCRRTTLGPRVGGVIDHLPRIGLVSQWHHRRLDVKAELSWPEAHVYLTARARRGEQTDHAIGLLMTSEFDRGR